MTKAERYGLPLRKSEDAICKEICTRLGGALRGLGEIDNKRVQWAHIPNGGSRNVKEAAKFKAMGVLPGWPDYQFLWTHKDAPSAPAGNLFIEVKTMAGELSGEQISFRDFCFDAGIPWALVRSADECIDVLRKAGAPMSGARG